MIDNKEHLEFEVLSDFVDGVLDQRQATAVQEHLTVCQVCSGQLKSLQEVLSEIGQLPKSVLPQEDLWPDLRVALNSRKELALPTSGNRPLVGNGSTARTRKSWRFAAILAAAAVILVLLSSGITALVLRREGGAQEIARTKSPSAPTPLTPTGAMLPASFQRTESEFTRTIEELKQAVDTQRGQLSPETVRTVDRSLAVVDSAIAEARAALLADPNNQMLVDLLSTTYQRKLDLLRRTSELGSRT